MSDSRVSRLAWRITWIILIATIAMPISAAILIAAQAVPATNQIVWNGFDHQWSINSGSIIGTEWEVQPISSSIALAVHPIDRSAFVFEARVTTNDPNIATGLIINAPDQLNFTAFLISGDGYMSLREMRSGAWIDTCPTACSSAGREPWREWPHVQRAGQSNTLRVECDLKRCIFWVNDEVTLLQNSLTPGQAIGLIAYPIGGTEPQARVAFDRVVAIRPAASPAADSAP